MKLAMGRLGFFKPTRARRMARETAFTASSWPIRRWWRVSSMFSNLADSLSVSFCTGTPVQDATMWAMSSSVTIGVRSPSAAKASVSAAPSAARASELVPSVVVSDTPASEGCSSLRDWRIERICSRSSTSLSRSSPALVKSCSRTAVSFSFCTARSCLSTSLAAGGSFEFISRTLLPASSTRSMALSGRKRSEM